jgi:hypothetical protein
MACAEAKHRIAEAIRIFFMGYPFRLNSGNAKLSRDCSNISSASLRHTVQGNNILFYFRRIPGYSPCLAARDVVLNEQKRCHADTVVDVFCQISREFLMNSKAIHKFAKSLPSRVKCRLRGCSSMVEQKLPKLTTRVRFPSPAPFFAGAWFYAARPLISSFPCLLIPQQTARRGR